MYRDPFARIWGRYLVESHPRRGHVPPCGHQHQSDMPVVPFTMRDFMGQGVFESFVAGGTLGKRIAPGTPAGYAEALKTALVAT